MAIRRAALLWTSAAVGLAIGAAVAVRASAIEPFLDIEKRLLAVEMFAVRVQARGGGAIERVRLETPPGLMVRPGDEFGPLKPGTVFEFRVSVPRDFPRPVDVTVVQMDPAFRTTSVRLDEAR